MAVTYEDRLRISTPEGVDVELTLGGLGSRLPALLIDGLIQIGLLAGLAGLIFLPAVAAGGDALMLAYAVYGVCAFVVIFGYHIALETLASGRTPGKRLMGLRVVRADGGPVDFRSSVVRNLLRLVDGPLSGYLGGIVSVIVSPRNQRIGDLAAGTLVVRERRGRLSRLEAPGYLDRTREVEAWDVHAVTADDLAAVRRFLDRRGDLTGDSRRHLAWELAARLRPKVVGAPERLAPEAFLEGVAAAKSGRS